MAKNKELFQEGDGSYGFSDVSQEHLQDLLNTPFPWGDFKKMAQDGLITQRNKQAMPDGGEYYEIVFPKSHEGLALHYLLTVWKESFTGFPAQVKAVGERESVIVQTHFMGPNPVQG